MLCSLEKWNSTDYKWTWSWNSKFPVVLSICSQLLGRGSDGQTWRNNLKVFRLFLPLTLAALGVSRSTGLAPDIARVKSSVNLVFEILGRKSKIDQVMSLDFGIVCSYNICTGCLRWAWLFKVFYNCKGFERTCSTELQKEKWADRIFI